MKREREGGIPAREDISAPRAPRALRLEFPLSHFFPI